jgi:FKBP-type peptidyl-prolyl cis-trans isomerase (trigger factor)
MPLATNVSVNPQKGSQTILVGEILEEGYRQFRAGALETLQTQVSLDGFRKGKVPESILVKHVGEGAVLMEIAERAITQAMRELLEEHKLDPVADPEVTLTKLAPGNPIGFKIVVTTMPEVALPDYLSLAKKENANKQPVEVSEKELADAVFNIRKANIPKDAEVTQDEIEKHLPALNDEFVKTLGAFSHVEDFMEKLRAHLLKAKTDQAAEKRRGALADALIEKTGLELPEVFVESELAKMTAQLKQDVGNLGISWDEYLKKLGKSEEEMRKEWRGDAEKRAKLQLILAEIAKKETLVPSHDDVHAEAAHLMQHYPDADHERVEAYVVAVKTNQKVWEFLDAQ